MRSTTLRHLIVAAICATGVVGLYLLPQPRHAVPSAEPRVVPDTTVVPSVASPAPPATRSAAPTVAATADGTTRPVRTAVVVRTPYDPDQPVETRRPTTPAPAAPTSAATSPRPTAPSTTRPPSSPAPTPTASATPTGTPPSQVTGVEVTETTSDQLSLVWLPSTDDRGVHHYEVRLNSQQVGEDVTETRATVPWAADSTTELALTVIAYDVDGLASPPSAAIAVTRPTPEPSPTGVAPSPSETP